MCHAQPGTRCQPHLRQKVENSRLSLLKASEEYKEARDKARSEGKVEQRKKTLKRLEDRVTLETRRWRTLKDEMRQTKEGLREVRHEIATSPKRGRSLAAGSLATDYITANSRKLVDRAHKAVNSPDAVTVYEDGGDSEKVATVNGRRYSYTKKDGEVIVGERAEYSLDDDNGGRHTVMTITELDYVDGLPKTNKSLSGATYTASTDEDGHYVNAYVGKSVCVIDRTGYSGRPRRVYHLEADYKADDFESSDKTGVRVRDFYEFSTPQERLVAETALKEAGFDHVIFVPEHI